MKFFSIITVCKDNLEELKKTHESIITQTINDYEWIVIDGNSKDGTQVWLENTYEANWISEPDKGIFDAMNKGLNKSSGKYIIFMNSGDTFASEEVLSKTRTGIENNSYTVFIYGDSIDISEDNNEFYRKAKNYKKLWMGMITQHQAMFFKREKLGETKYSEKYPLTADYAFVSEIVMKSGEDEILYLNFPICNFSMGGVNEKYRFRAIKEDYKIRRTILKLPVITALILYLLHYTHTVLKKANPSVRFIRHKSIKQINN